MTGDLMAAEIAEQPEVLGRILQTLRPRIEEIGRVIRERRPRFVLFVARGTSDHAALYAKYLVETKLGLPAGLVSPSSVTVYDSRPDLRDVLYIAVSQSGSSPDLAEPLLRARAGGATTLAVTNAPASPLAGLADFHLEIGAGPERAVAATKTYSAQLLTLYLLVGALAGDARENLSWLPDRMRAVLDLGGEVALLAVRYRFAEQLVVTARGFNYPTARETALKLMETSYIVAHAFSGADLLHGPMAMIDRGFPVVAIAPPGPGAIALLPVLERLREIGADTLVVGGADLANFGTVALTLPDLGPESLSPVLAILPMQQFAFHLARERGLDPDRPRGLEKVTRTW
ncbi:MAG: SIS domain-containing protein [Chloroflexota bacterium]|nr:SIS domain-containing protein [Chloroflexota bacterium]